MQNPEQNPMKATTLKQKTDIIAGLALFPSMTLMVFIRRRPGYRFLDPMKLFGMFIVLVVGGGFSIASPGGPYPFLVFALAMLITGLVKRRMRWRDIKGGVSWHTYSRGISWFSSLLPVSDSKVKRFVDPAVCAIVGLLVSFIFPFLGYYILASAFFLFVFEAWDYEQALNRMLDILDDQVDSEVMSDNVAYYSQEHPQQRPLDQTAGIPTGIAPDIEAQIQKRKNRPQAVVVDNLAVS